MLIKYLSLAVFVPHIRLVPEQVDTGEYFPVEMEENDYRCEYWISPSFQTCLKLKESKHKTNVFLLDGQYFERGERISLSLG